MLNAVYSWNTGITIEQNAAILMKEINKYTVTTDVSASPWWSNNASGTLYMELKYSQPGNWKGQTLAVYVNGVLGGLPGHQPKRAMGYGTCRGNDIVGAKSYELANHLGNVLAVISDRIWAVDDGVYNTTTGIKTSSTADGLADYYTATVVSYSDYDPFGTIQDGRKGQANGLDYSYGFNGMEGDPEVKGQGNSYTTEFRQYDPRLGRWLSIDPVVHSFISPYNSFSNNPIIMIDPDGADDLKFDEAGNYVEGKKRGKLYEFFFGSKGEVVNSNGDIIQTFKFNDRKDGQIEKFTYGIDEATGEEGTYREFNGISLDFGEKADGIVDRAIEGAPKTSGLVGKILTLLWIGGQSASEINLEGSEAEVSNTLDFMSHYEEWAAPDGQRLNIANGIGYNDFDANNFLWGNAMKKLGFGLDFSRLAAHANAIWFGKLQNANLLSEEVYEKLVGIGALEFKFVRLSLKDARADQKAIRNGYRF